MSIGSLIEAQGSLYVVDTAAETPAGAAGAGTFLYFEEAIPRFVWSSAVGTFDPTRGGIYDVSDRRQCRFKLRSATTWEQLIVAEAADAEVVGNFRSENAIIGPQALSVITIELGDWDMDADQTLQVSLGSIAAEDVRQVQVIIRDDNDDFRTDLLSVTTGSVDGNWRLDLLTDDNLELFRDTGGGYDNGNFDATSYNRGWATVWYVE